MKRIMRSVPRWLVLTLVGLLLTLVGRRLQRRWPTAGRGVEGVGQVVRGKPPTALDGVADAAVERVADAAERVAGA